jgi:hypothetical protein
MREMQCREQGRFVTGIQRRHEAVDYGERRAYRSLIRLGLNLVDTDGPSPSGGHFTGGHHDRKRQPTAPRKMRI